jgi:starch phosphorylase
VKVELYADAGQGGAAGVELMAACKACANSKGTITYSARISATHPAEDYTARIIPQHANASVPLEAMQILWQR